MEITYDLVVGMIRILAVFLEVIDDHIAGDPMDEKIRWTNLSYKKIAAKMKEEAQMIVKVRGEMNRSLSVRVANLKNELTTLRLFSDSGTKIQTENVDNEHAYAKNWNLENVADGNYFLYIDSKETTLIQSISVKGNKVEVGAVQRLDF